LSRRSMVGAGGVRCGVAMAPVCELGRWLRAYESEDVRIVVRVQMWNFNYIRGVAVGEIFAPL
jgi:hypothetical protein